MLFFETFLQNAEDAPEHWSRPDEIEEGIDLATVSAPMVVSTSITRGLLPYFRWCIAIPGHASAQERPPDFSLPRTDLNLALFNTPNAWD